MRVQELSFGVTRSGQRGLFTNGLLVIPVDADFTEADAERLCKRWSHAEHEFRFVGQQ